MSKVTEHDKAIAVAKFSKVRTRAVLDWETDDRRNVPVAERRRARWSKEDIIRICEWPGEWRELRKLLQRKVGLIMLRDGAPRKDLLWTFATCEDDRQEYAVNTLAIQIGVSQWAGETLNIQIAPPDEDYALSEEGRDAMNRKLEARYGTTLEKLSRAISEIKADLLTKETKKLLDGGDGS